MCQSCARYGTVAGLICSAKITVPTSGHLETYAESIVLFLVGNHSLVNNKSQFFVHFYTDFCLVHMLYF